MKKMIFRHPFLRVKHEREPGDFVHFETENRPYSPILNMYIDKSILLTDDEKDQIKYKMITTYSMYGNRRVWAHVYLSENNKVKDIIVCVSVCHKKSKDVYVLERLSCDEYDLLTNSLI